MEELNVKEGLAAQSRMLEKLQSYPKLPKVEDSSIDFYPHYQVGGKNIFLLMGATTTHMVAIIRSDKAPVTHNTTMTERAELRKKWPNDMWEFSSTDPAEVEKQFNDLLDKLETT